MAATGSEATGSVSSYKNMLITVVPSVVWSYIAVQALRHIEGLRTNIVRLMRVRTTRQTNQ